MASHVQDNRNEKSIREAAQRASGKTFLACAQCLGYVEQETVQHR